MAGHLAPPEVERASGRPGETGSLKGDSRGQRERSGGGEGERSGGDAPLGLPPAETRAAAGFGLQVYRGGQRVESGRLDGERLAAAADSAPSGPRAAVRPPPGIPPPRRKYTPLTPDEREQRAAEMAGAAQAHEAQRRVLLQEQPAQAAPEGGGAERPAFLDGVARDVYASTSVDSISDRINQSRHYMQRGSSAAAEGFMRPS